VGSDRLEHRDAVAADRQALSSMEHELRVRAALFSRGRLQRHILYLYDARRACNAAAEYGNSYRKYRGRIDF
jgi:hypothetical protein